MLVCLRAIMRITWSVFVLFLLADMNVSYAQQTIFNVPNQDVLAPGQVYGEIDVPFRITEPKFVAVTPRVVIGLGADFEGGVNLPGYISSGDPLLWTAVVALKHGNTLDDSGSWTMTEGVHGYFPLTKGPDAGIFGYAMLGKKFSNGIRISGGIYGATKAVTGTTSAIGALGAIEVPLNNWLTFATDAYSGANSLGYISPGVAIIPFENAAIYAAYQFSNATSDADSFLIELGYTF